MVALCIGQSAYNIVAVSSEFPLENTKNKFEKIDDCPGGSAANMAYLFGRYGVDTYIGSATGDDSYGSIVKKELERVGVHTEYMETVFEKKTSSSFIIIGQKNNSRTIYDVTREPLFLKKTEFQISPDLVITDGYDYGAALAAFNRYSDKITIIDAGMYNKEIMELCKYAKYIVASKEFAEAVSGSRVNYENPQSLVTIYSQLVNKFPGKTIIVTLEDKGAMYMAGNQIKVMPGLNLKVVDPSGAGDIFHAAFGYALLQGYDMERAITFANIAGGLTVTKVGTIDACPELSDVMQYFVQKYGTSEVPGEETPAEGGPAEGGQEAAPVADPNAAAQVATPAPDVQPVAPAVAPNVQSAPVSPAAPVTPTPAAPVNPEVGPAVAQTPVNPVVAPTPVDNAGGQVNPPLS